jgi:protein gp37
VVTKLGTYEVHPAADVFPLLDDDELKHLADDILRQGLQEPIVLTADGRTLVDGRNRYRACDLLNIEPEFTKLGDHYTEKDILDYVISANVHRRHLNPGQRAMVAAALEPMYAAVNQIGRPYKDAEKLGPIGPNLPDERKSTARAGKVVGASRTSVTKAKAVKRDTPDLAEKVVTGELTLDAADRERKKHNATLPKPEPTPKPHRAEPIMLNLKTHTGDEVKYPKPQGKATFNETTGAGISWAAWSWNPVTGCLHGCNYCYAREIATSQRFAAAYPVGFTPLFHHERLDAPKNTVIPARHTDDEDYKRVFVCSMADLYGRWVPDEWIDQVHAAMLESPQWQYITLTKFPDRYPGLKMPDGAWVGTSVDEQKRVRIAERAFSELPDGVIKWLSLEPLLEPLEFTDLSVFDWVVIGAQTETRQPTGVVPAFAPPFEWVARIVTQAREAGCQIHMKPNLLANPGMQLLNEYPTSEE